MKARTHTGLALVWAALAGLWWAAPARGSTPWRFVAVGDSRGTSTVINAEIVAELAVAITNERPELLIFSGDLVLGPGSESQFSTWTNAMAPVYAAGIAVWPVRGNHDVGTGWDTVFGSRLPTNGPAGETGVTYWATNRNALFVALDQYVAANRVSQSWLDACLASNRVPHVFAFGHSPAFKVDHTDCLDDYPAERDAFWDSLAAAGARVYFCGHDHFYDHARIDDGDGNPANDLHQYLVGTAGAPLRDFAPYDGDNGAWSPTNVFREKEFGYVVADVDGYDVTLTWKHRTAPGVYEAAETFSYAAPYLWSEAVNLGDHWKWLPWFGFFHEGYFPWIYHDRHGWMWSNSESTSAMWLYTLDLGWLYTGESLYPWLYRFDAGAWLWYLTESKSPRWFYNAATGLWETR